MAVNTAPVFPKTPMATVGTVLSAANTTKDGTAGTVPLLFQAGADGARLDFIKAVPIGTNVKTVLRLFLNNNLNPTVPTNNSLIKEYALPSTTLDEDDAMAPEIDIPLNLNIPPNYRVYGVLATAAAAGWALTPFARSYTA